ncbi:hypothetical protein WJX73_002683 [Symbiochloris irregularis]|uniref:Uncharacterized protein n=1 Tax=Symbiochloris irregularis TaxID=706552 RepID=A0AAW1NKK4_9CHLO
MQAGVGGVARDRRSGGGRTPRDGAPGGKGDGTGSVCYGGGGGRLHYLWHELRAALAGAPAYGVGCRGVQGIWARRCRPAGGEAGGLRVRCPGVGAGRGGSAASGTLDSLGGDGCCLRALPDYVNQCAALPVFELLSPSHSGGRREDADYAGGRELEGVMGQGGGGASGRGGEIPAGGDWWRGTGVRVGLWGVGGLLRRPVRGEGRDVDGVGGLGGRNPWFLVGGVWEYACLCTGGGRAEGEVCGCWGGGDRGWGAWVGTRGGGVGGGGGGRG